MLQISHEVTVFLLASTVMALGIGLDAALATLTQVPHLKNQSQRIYWVAGVSVTHTLFPMIGYLLAHYSIQSFPLITPIIGVIACGLVLNFLYDELFIETKEDPSPSLWISVGLILAVSWDALWSGPAKSAQVIDWSQWMIWFSFVWVGLLVCLLCVVSCFLGQRCLHKIKLNSKPMEFISWLQLSVIGYFGILVFIRFTLQWSLSELWIFILSGALVWSAKRIKKVIPIESVQA